MHHHLGEAVTVSRRTKADVRAVKCHTEETVFVTVVFVMPAVCRTGGGGFGGEGELEAGGLEAALFVEAEQGLPAVGAGTPLAAFLPLGPDAERGSVHPFRVVLVYVVELTFCFG